MGGGGGGASYLHLRNSAIRGLRNGKRPVSKQKSETAPIHPNSRIQRRYYYTSTHIRAYILKRHPLTRKLTSIPNIAMGRQQPYGVRGLRSPKMGRAGIDTTALKRRYNDWFLRDAPLFQTGRSILNCTPFACRSSRRRNPSQFRATRRNLGRFRKERDATGSSFQKSAIYIRSGGGLTSAFGAAPISPTGAEAP